jgi:hypothetical protein
LNHVSRDYNLALVRKVEIGYGKKEIFLRPNIVFISSQKGEETGKPVAAIILKMVSGRPTFDTRITPVGWTQKEVLP